MRRSRPTNPESSPADALEQVPHLLDGQRLPVIVVDLRGEEAVALDEADVLRHGLDLDPPVGLDDLDLGARRELLEKPVVPVSP
jgi:hypothetical protein